MASSQHDGSGKDGDKSNLPSAGQQKSELSDQLDLDKNPIKFRQSDGSLSTEAHDKDYMELTLRSGKHSDLVKKIMRQRIEQRAQEFPRWPASMSSGVRALWIESRFWYDRERLLPEYDKDWRMYRSRYLHSLELDPREPVAVPGYERSLINPIRRFYMKGGDFIENYFVKLFTKNKYESATYRVFITRMFIGWFVVMGAYYSARYNRRKWETTQGMEIAVTAPIMYPGHPNFPWKNPRWHPGHHQDQGFTRRKIYEDLRDFQDNTTSYV